MPAWTTSRSGSTRTDRPARSAAGRASFTGSRAGRVLLPVLPPPGLPHQGNDLREVHHEPAGLVLGHLSHVLDPLQDLGQAVEREIGVTYKTAWRMFGEIRTLLSQDDGSLPAERANAPASPRPILQLSLDRVRKGDPVAPWRDSSSLLEIAEEVGLRMGGVLVLPGLALGLLGALSRGHPRRISELRAGPRPSWSRGRRPGWRGPSRGRCRRPCSRRRGPPGRRRPRC